MKERERQILGASRSTIILFHLQGIGCSNSDTSAVRYGGEGEKDVYFTLISMHGSS